MFRSDRCQMRLLFSLLILPPISACTDSDFSVEVLLRGSVDIASREIEKDPTTGLVEPLVIGSIQPRDGRSPLVSPDNDFSFGPFTAGVGINSPVFGSGCFPLFLEREEDEVYAQGLTRVDLSEFNESALDKILPNGERFSFRGYLHGSYVLPGGETVSLGALTREGAPLPLGFEVDQGSRRIRIECQVGAVDDFNLLEVSVTGTGVVELDAPVPERPVRCNAEVSPCVVSTRQAATDIEVAIDPSRREQFLGFRDPEGAVGACPLVDAPRAARYTTGPGTCVAVFDGWSTNLVITPNDVGVGVVPVSESVRIDPADAQRALVLDGALDEAVVSMQNNGFPIQVTSASGDCRPAAELGSVVLTRPGDGPGACSVSVDVDPVDPDAPRLSFQGATAPEFAVDPGPDGAPLACTTEDGDVTCASGLAVVETPLEYDRATGVTVSVPPTEGRIAFEGDCRPRMGRDDVATVQVDGPRLCQPFVFHILRIVTDVDVELSPGPDGGPRTLCVPGRDGVDCDADGQDDVLEYERPTDVTITAQEDATFRGDCTAGADPRRSVLEVRDRVDCTLSRTGAQRDARLEIRLGSEPIDDDPASRVVVVDPNTGAEVDRCAYDRASGFGSRACVLTGLPRTMRLVPEADGEGNVAFARFTEFVGDCAGEMTQGPDGWTLDIRDLLDAGEAPSNNEASCEAVFGCTDDAVLDTIDLEIRDGATTVGTLSADVGADCTESGPRIRCRLGRSIDVPENTVLDVVTTTSGGAPGVFEELFFPLDLSTVTTPAFEKTASGSIPVRLQLGGCRHFYHVEFDLD